MDMPVHTYTRCTYPAATGEKAPGGLFCTAGKRAGMNNITMWGITVKEPYLPFHLIQLKI